MSQFKFTTLGVMLDMTQNAVMTPDTLKKFMKLIKRFGYNTLILSLQGACSMPNQPYIGYLRPRYSAEELHEIENYAVSLHMEIIPSVSMDQCRSGHASREQLQETFCKAVDFLFGIFHSRKIFLEMAEDDVNTDRSDESYHIVTKDLTALSKLCREKGLAPLTFSNLLINDVSLKKYPKSVIPVALDGMDEGMSPTERLSITKKLSVRAWMAGRLYGGTGIIPHNGLTIRKGLPLIDLCRQEKCRNLIFVCKSPDGSECSPFALLPALCYLGQFAKGIVEENVIKAKFKSTVGMQFDDFMTIDLPNQIAGNEKDSSVPCNPSKYMLYADLFNGFLDCTVREGGNERYAEIAERLHQVARKSRRYGYLFDTAAALCDVLAIKYELGVKTRWSYGRGRKWDLHLFAFRTYGQLLTALRTYRDTAELQWMNENKAAGFEVTEYRLAGVSARIESCRRRLIELSDGIVEKIDELETPILPYPGSERGQSICFNKYAANVSACNDN